MGRKNTKEQKGNYEKENLNALFYTHLEKEFLSMHDACSQASSFSDLII